MLRALVCPKRHFKAPMKIKLVHKEWVPKNSPKKFGCCSGPDTCLVRAMKSIQRDFYCNPSTSSAKTSIGISKNDVKKNYLRLVLFCTQKPIKKSCDVGSDLISTFFPPSDGRTCVLNVNFPVCRKFSQSYSNSCFSLGKACLASDRPLFVCLRASWWLGDVLG